MKTILTPTDFSQRSEYAFNLAAEFARKFNAQLVLFYVIPQEQTHFAKEIMVEQQFTIPGYSEEDLIKRRRKKVLEEFEKVIPDYKEQKIRVRAEVVVGNPVEKILDAVKEFNVDLVVMGTHGRTGINLALIGSVAEKIVRHSPVPVTTVKAPGFQSEN
jgi:nucleotide-binding universal stress UspA family protein